MRQDSSLFMYADKNYMLGVDCNPALGVYARVCNVSTLASATIYATKGETAYEMYERLLSDKDRYIKPLLERIVVK